MEGLSKKEKKRKTHGHRQQCGDCQGEVMREVDKGIEEINNDGRRPDFGW